MPQYLTFLVAFFPFLLHGQVNTGAILSGADVSIGYHKNIESTLALDKSIKISVSAAYFLTPRMALGIRLFESISPNPFENTSFNNLHGIGGLMKYYYPLKSRFGFSFTSTLEYGYTENDKPYPDFVPQFVERFVLAQFGGVYFFLSHNIVLEGNVGLLNISRLHGWNGSYLTRSDRKWAGNEFHVSGAIPGNYLLGDISFSVNYLFNNGKR